MRQIELVVPPMTPFDGAGGIDWTALRRQIDYIVDVCRATQVVAAGVEAQEYQMLDMATRRELIRRTVEFTAGRVPVIVGVSSPDAATCISLAAFAAELGASAIQVLAPLRPFGGPPTERDLVLFYEAVAREVSLPIVLYLNPGPGADVSIPATVTLAKLPQVKLVKESSRDLARVSRLIVEVDHAGHATYLTTMQMLLATITLGGAGATMPAPAAEIARGVIDAWQDGDMRRASELQLQFALFPARWMHKGLTPTMKAALTLIGCPAGQMQAPWQGLSDQETADLATFLRGTLLGRHMAARAA